MIYLDFKLAAEVNLSGLRYDGLGRWHTRENWATQWSLSYLFDGLNAVQIQYSNGPPANLLTGLGLDQRFQWSDSSGTVDFMTDAIGSTWGLANSSGVAQTNFTYGPFGYTTGSGTETNSDYDFVGRELDDNNILYYMRNRYYSPVLSRFLSPDPSGLAGGDVNLYAYAHNDPTNLTDPMGLSTGGVGGGGGGGGGENLGTAAYLHQAGDNGPGGGGPEYGGTGSCNTCGVIASQAGGVGNLNVGGLLRLGGGNLFSAQELGNQPPRLAPGMISPEQYDELRNYTFAAGFSGTVAGATAFTLLTENVPAGVLLGFATGGVFSAGVNNALRLQYAIRNADPAIAGTPLGLPEIELPP